MFGALVMAPYARAPRRLLRGIALAIAAAAIYYGAIRFVVDVPIGLDAMATFMIAGAGAALLCGLAVAVIAPQAFNLRARGAAARRGCRGRCRLRHQGQLRPEPAARPRGVAAADLSRAAFRLHGLDRHNPAILASAGAAPVKFSQAASLPHSNNDDRQGEITMRGTVLMWRGDKGVVTAARSALRLRHQSLAGQRRARGEHDSRPRDRGRQAHRPHAGERCGPREGEARCDDRRRRQSCAGDPCGRRQGRRDRLRRILPHRACS